MASIISDVMNLLGSGNNLVAIAKGLEQQDEVGILSGLTNLEQVLGGIGKAVPDESLWEECLGTAYCEVFGKHYKERSRSNQHLHERLIEIADHHSSRTARLAALRNLNVLLASQQVMKMLQSSPLLLPFLQKVRLTCTWPCSAMASSCTNTFCVGIKRMSCMCCRIPIQTPWVTPSICHPTAYGRCTTTRADPCARVFLA